MRKPTKKIGKLAQEILAASRNTDFCEGEAYTRMGYAHARPDADCPKELAILTILGCPVPGFAVALRSTID